MLYSFGKGGPDDGASPVAGVINIKGVLYGTTEQGGKYGHVDGAYGYGTVFNVTPSGTETVLHSFKGGTGDGKYPEAGLVDVRGTLYGTADEGGTKDRGTVFAITRSGNETVLYKFKGGSRDGAHPSAGLINVAGTLYGETLSGGTGENRGSGDGTVFSITLSGVETVLYRFKGGSGDGESPYGGLVNVRGTLYGTTYMGGANGNGTVFSITPSGKETVVYSFKGGSADGAHPYASLVEVNGTLYGTTFEGGAKNEGTVFSITPSGKEIVLHSFKGGSADGAYPIASLVNLSGTLYGTTPDGGSNCKTGSGYHGCGTIFAITPSGKETVLYKFKGGSRDGFHPSAGLIDVAGTLYGTTPSGGSGCYGARCGTVFWLSP
ncbi:MAG TPA: choice-of-anchor tandem repeat GloVer-containing protein [Candidatus Cybelea sp.]|nr:choice-of-anchor tandem repeat GloVer-containing protein [Candidatus Cybelea sp.]